MPEHSVPPTLPIDLDDDERVALAELLSDTIERDRFPLSPRIRRLKAILDKLDAPRAMAEPYPPLKRPGEASLVLARKRRR
ncbi:MAG TPA: hypothetical protein VKQ73_02090 [Stellaceae bacterium]|nr:hypothetical protein [Stellaceae bacterium]